MPISPRAELSFFATFSRQPHMTRAVVVARFYVYFSASVVGNITSVSISWFDIRRLYDILVFLTPGHELPALAREMAQITPRKVVSLVRNCPIRWYAEGGVKEYTWPADQRLDSETVAELLRNLTAPDRASLIANLPDLLSPTMSGDSVLDPAHQPSRHPLRPM